MREILFRGKSIYTKVWVYGYLTSKNCVEEVEVIPETIGQFTGLCDKNGNKIFEGDIVKFSTRRYHLGRDKGLQTITFKSDVIFQDGCFIISETQKYDTYLYAFNNESEIIGNIHDIENRAEN